MWTGTGGATRRRRWSTTLLLAAAASACVATTPSARLSEEHLVVLNAGDGTLALFPLSDPDAARWIPLGDIGGTPVSLAARNTQGLVTSGAGSSVAIVDLSTAGSVLVYRLATGAGAGGAAFVNDTLAYITNTFNDRATRLNLKTGDTVSVAVGHTPTAVTVTRGRVYVANANLELACDGPLPCVAGPSWLTVIDPDRNVVLDSIPLPGPGNASSVLIGPDGLIYVMNSGPGGTDPGRLSIVDPVLRQEVGSFSGFGPLPGRMASDGRERLFITSTSQGLMEFNTRTRRVVRGAGAGIPLINGVAAAVDANAQVYAVESGSCAPGVPGRVRIFRPDLTEARVVTAGVCPADAAIVNLPPPP
ncbi:MAG TPA: hypothetical protein VFU23_00865 [Gemmatimonadales bacterium]|nr:hypothetical protein [Gemmatimonadales bacterium]